MSERTLNTRICAAEVRRIAQSLRDQHQTVTPGAIAGVLGYNPKQLAYAIRESVALQDIFDHKPWQPKVVKVPYLRAKDLKHAVLINWLLGRLADGGQERHPELRVH